MLTCFVYTQFFNLFLIKIVILNVKEPQVSAVIVSCTKYFVFIDLLIDSQYLNLIKERSKQDINIEKSELFIIVYL